MKKLLMAVVLALITNLSGYAASFSLPTVNLPKLKLGKQIPEFTFPTSDKDLILHYVPVKRTYYTDNNFILYHITRNNALTVGGRTGALFVLNALFFYETTPGKDAARHKQWDNILRDPTLAHEVLLDCWAYTQDRNRSFVLSPKKVPYVIPAADFVDVVALLTMLGLPPPLTEEQFIQIVYALPGPPPSSPVMGNFFDE
jgi:hypothetical protein